MKVVIIGAGNVASSLATELYKHSYKIVQIYNRTIESAEILANKVNALYTNRYEDITTDGDLYIFSLKDSVLANVASNIPSNKGLWVHTAGSMPLETLNSYTDRCGVLYPLQTFTKGRQMKWENIPLFIEASRNSDLKKLNTIANDLSSKVAVLSSDKRKYVHLSGVFACNFVNHMYALSEEFLKQADLPFDVVIPLINETCLKIHDISPKDAQTGPAIRFDENVINNHLDLIKDEQIRDIYQLISKNIHTKNRTNE